MTQLRPRSGRGAEVTQGLLRSEQFYESLFRAMVEGVVVQDADGVIIACNDSAQRILGLSEDQLRGLTSVDPLWRTVNEDGTVLPGEDHPAMVTLRTGEPCRGVIMGVHTPDGGLRWIEVNAEILQPTGDLAGSVLTTFHDVTEQVAARQALEASEGRFALAMEGSNSGIWDWFDVNSTEEWWSPRFYELLGYEPGEIEPNLEQFKALLHPDDIDRTFQAVQGAIYGTKNFDIEYRLRTKQGQYRWFLARAAVERDRRGQAVRMTGSITDIHARHMARAELNRFFTMSVDLVAVADLDGHLRRVNPAFVTELGYSEEELLAQPFLDLVHPDDLEETLNVMGALSEGESVHAFHNRYRHRAGHWVWLSWTARADSSGKVYAIARNVTDERRARDALARRADELELTNEELEQFAYVASHDLQEPLRTLTSYAELVTEGYADVLDDNGREFLGYMTEAADRLRTLIQALLRYSRLGGVPSTFEATPLDGVVANVIKDLGVAIEEAGAEVVVEALPTIRCDADLIGRVFQNLIGNAVKFRGVEAPRVRITAERTRVGWEIQVYDNGIGVGEAHRERIFEVFKRLHSRQKYPGTGMGLAICRRIIQRHGGTIWCTTNSGGGSVFHFTMLSEGPIKVDR